MEWAKMDAAERREVVSERLSRGASLRSIAREFGVSPGAVVGFAWRQTETPERAARRNEIRAAKRERKRVEREAARSAVPEVVLPPPGPPPPGPPPPGSDGPDPPDDDAPSPKGPGALENRAKQFPPDARPGPIWEMGARQCRFMPGGQDDFVCCGAPALTGTAWCREHHPVVYISSTNRESEA